MSNVPNAEPDPILLARHLYESLASGDAGSVRALLHPSFTGRTTEGLYTRITQRLLAMAACIWHNWAVGEPVKRSLIAFDN